MTPSINNERRFSSWQKMVWVQRVTFLASLLFLFSIIILSLASYIQTEMAFKPLNDPSIIFFGIGIGQGMSHLMAIIFQYGQNVALLYRSVLYTNVTFFSAKIFGKRKSFTDRDLALVIFFVFALVDGGTNILWLYDYYVPTGDPIKDFMVQGVSYSGMMFLVFVEELMGVAMEGVSWSWANLKKIARTGATSHTFSPQNNHLRPGGSKKAPQQGIRDALQRPLPPIKKEDSGTGGIGTVRKSKFSKILKSQGDNLITEDDDFDIDDFEFLKDAPTSYGGVMTRDKNKGRNG